MTEVSKAFARALNREQGSRIFLIRWQNTELAIGITTTQSEVIFSKRWCIIATGVLPERVES